MTHRLSEINKRHKAIKESSQVTPLNDTSWKVSSSNFQSHYTVSKVMDDSCSCSFHCHTCGVCVHIFMCTCMDFILHATVCKHIHVHFIKVHLDSIWTPEGESSVLVETTSVWEDEKSNAPICNLLWNQLNLALQL